MIKVSLKYNKPYGKRTIKSKVTTEFETNDQIRKFLESEEAKFWSDHYMGGTYEVHYGKKSFEKRVR